MNVRLKYYMEFTAGCCYDNDISMANYQMNLHMLTVSQRTEDHNVALERIKYFVYKQLESSIFINVEDKDRCRLLSDAGLRLTTLPTEPFDQIVGLMLYSKLNAIMEGRMLVTELEFSSDIGSNVVYLHNEEESAGPFKHDGWWSESDLRHHHGMIDNTKIMSMNRDSTWRDLDLGWAKSDDDNTGNTIVFADFNRNAPK